MKTIGIAAALLAVGSMLLFAQDFIKITATTDVPATNVCECFYATNDISVFSSVDGAIKQLREQGDMTNLIKKLVESGDVCAVVGHKWENVPHVTLEYRPDGDYPAHRKCTLCGKVETTEPGAWK